MDEITRNIRYAEDIISKYSDDYDEVVSLRKSYVYNLSHMERILSRKEARRNKNYGRLCAIRDSVRDKYIVACDNTIQNLKRILESARELKTYAEVARIDYSVSSILAGPGGSTVGAMEIEEKIRRMRQKSYELQALAEIRKV